MKIVSVVGARPQFIKAAAVSRVLRQRHQELLVHTGQHYDYGLSQVFFDELDLPQPDLNLGVGSGPHGEQTGAMLAAIERVLIQQRPDWVLVYGDTNSTLAGALAAVKLHMPVAHVEAGLRSYNRSMPEEINRVLTDHVSSLLFCPTETAARNLAAEGISQGVHLVGDVMYDALLHSRALGAKKGDVLGRFGLVPKQYLLATVHRPANTDDAGRLRAILEAFGQLGETILFPAHPRTRKALAREGLDVPENVWVVDPVGYLEMLQLEEQARLILTDSGGVQKEAYLLGVPCVTLREETEWVETVEAGWNRLVGADGRALLAAVREWEPPADRPNCFGDGRASERIVALLGSTK
ncbi:MAG TPA: UDP-N-acetylglucosamine 2-epimerase (non-hydrolyzing) [Anaerolineae bacterium]|nr:UDP-N-acetylglucosamine 2-epimerase (non-hydrolyzing) [Anaerolineae bacterium]